MTSRPREAPGSGRWPFAAAVTGSTRISRARSTSPTTQPACSRTGNPGDTLARMSGTADVRTLDVATFTVPPGWHVETRGSGDGQAIVVSKAAAATYCMAVVYASTPASTSLEASF